MLAASASTPNITQASHQSSPAAGNWHGVSEAMDAARQAIQRADLAQAENILTELLEFAPVEIKAWKLLAKTQRHLGHIEAGISSAKRALQLQNSDIEAMPLASITIAQLLWQQHEYDEARDMIALLIEQQPDNAEWLELQYQWDSEHRT
ncbi:MAG: hypothetical protein Q9M16_09585 [Mariprofundus sp.]|nr:hypothetical protein [Mariprofundus sp.]